MMMTIITTTTDKDHSVAMDDEAWKEKTSMRTKRDERVCKLVDMNTQRERQ